MLLETSLQRTEVVSKCQVRSGQAHGPRCFGPCDCTLRREVIHFRGFSVVLNIFSRDGEHTFQIKQKNLPFFPDLTLLCLGCFFNVNTEVLLRLILCTNSLYICKMLG